MLVELRIRNVAVIDSVSLPLVAGLNVLSGETGAGKSIIVGALGMLLGDRAAADRVRIGAEKGFVEGVFDVHALPALRALLDARGVDVDEGLLVLKREIGSNGRSRAWINGSPVTAATLGEVGVQLVSVHGQHDSRQLLDVDHQRDLLDAFAGALGARAQVEELYERAVRLRASEDAFRTKRAEVTRRADYLRFVAQEIEAARLVVGEDASLDDAIRRLSHAEELRTLAAQTAAELSGDDDAVLARLATVRRSLNHLARIDPDAGRWQASFDGAVYALDELARELSEYADGIEQDPSRLRTLEARRDLILAMLRKYGPNIVDVLHIGRQSRDELELVDGGELHVQALVEARRSAEVALVAAADALGTMRRNAAARLAIEVSALLPELGMLHGSFAVHFERLDHISAAGGERIDFLCALNAGSDQRPLHRIASGGELSRILLALSTVLARLQHVPTLVFDEVDAGIGGAVAWQVGALMRRVAGHHQVLAISHVAQIAARAHHHVVVRKGAVGAVTTADTTIVTDELRVVEIARMLGGDAEREVSRAHARELLERGAHDTNAADAPAARQTARKGRRVP